MHMYGFNIPLGSADSDKYMIDVIKQGILLHLYGQCFDVLLTTNTGCMMVVRKYSGIHILAPGLETL